MNELQLAKIVTLTSQLLEEKDIYTKNNIVGDKTIFAKQGLFVGDFNPAYDFFIKGRGCITGDLVIKGNLFYESTGNSLQESFQDVTVKPNKYAGFRFRDDIDTRGIIWDTKEEELIFADEKYFDNKSISSLLNMRLKNANMMNLYTKNILIESSIISTNTNNNLNIEANLYLKGNLKIDGNIFSSSDTIHLKSQLVTKNMRIEGNLVVDSEISTSKNVKCTTIIANNVDADDIYGVNLSIDGDLKINQNAEINGFFLSKKSGEFSQNLEIKGNLYCGKSIIFTNENAGIAFSKLSQIENASVSYINGKKITTQGDILTTIEQQELSNKSLGTNLDAKYNKIKNLDHPSDNHDAVNKSYVDQFIIGNHLLEPAKLATTKKLDAFFMASSFQLISKKMEALSIDNLEPDIGDRILVKNQEIPAENGIYIVISKGHRNQNWILQLADDYADIVKNRHRIVPTLLVRNGENNGGILFGLNCLTQKIWEFLGKNEFVNYSLLERVHELEKKIQNISLKLTQ